MLFRSVVRCHTAMHVGNKELKDVPPYPPGSSFFFKVKFDEPYMMYRDWREITKMVLSSKGVSKAKLRRPESVLYKKWVEEEIERDRKQFADFGRGRGIIATRERFLRWLETEGGAAKSKELQDRTTRENESVDKDKTKFGKTIIVPVAIPGCGKPINYSD